MLLLALIWAFARIRRALPRLRWLLLAVLGVFAWMTPGQYLWAGWLSPTYEGLYLGYEQMMRLLAVIASLQILLSQMNHQALFAGLFSLAKPLSWIGLSRERIAVRLALTIEMTESLLEKKMNFRTLLAHLDLPLEENVAREVVLALHPWTRWQKVVLLFLVLLMLISFWLGRHGAWL